MLNKKITTIIVALIISTSIVGVSHKSNNSVNNTIVDYDKKINNFKIYKFDKYNKLLHKITAKNLIIYLDKPDTIKQPILQFYTKNNYQISADIAKKLEENIINFIGNVKINSNKNKDFNLETMELTIDLDKKYFYSNTQVHYFSNNNRIKADGIKIFNSKNLIKLLGKTTIYLTNNLKNINQQSSIIHTHNLVIKNNIWTANKSKYIAKNVIINANKVVYDTIRKKIKLQQEVRAIYEIFD